MNEQESLTLAEAEVTSDVLDLAREAEIQVSTMTVVARCELPGGSSPEIRLTVAFGDTEGQHWRGKLRLLQAEAERLPDERVDVLRTMEAVSCLQAKLDRLERELHGACAELHHLTGDHPAGDAVDDDAQSADDKEL